MNEEKLLHLTGLSGILATLMGFTADWFLYGGFYGGAEFYTISRQIMGNVSNTRLMVGGLLGPIEAAFYIIGFGHIFLALRSGGKALAAITFGGLSWSVIVGAGAFHSAFVFNGLLLRAQKAITDPQVSWFQALLNDASQYIQLLYNVMFILGLVATFTFLFLVLFRKTLYSKWMVLFIPTLWVLILPQIAKKIPAPVGGMIVGGSLNLSFLLYFVVSMILLWRQKGLGSNLYRSK